MNKKIIHLCLGYMSSACQALLCNLQLLGQDIFVFCRPGSLLLLTSQASSQTLCNHSTFPAISSSCSYSFTHFSLISFYGGLSLSPSWRADFPSLYCKGILRNGLPFCTGVTEYLQCESGYFPSHFYNFPCFFLCSFFSLDVFLFFNLKPLLFFLIKQIHILLPSLLPPHSMKISHCCVLATEMGKVASS